MNIQEVIQTKVIEAVASLYDITIPSVEFQPTR